MAGNRRLSGPSENVFRNHPCQFIGSRRHAVELDEIFGLPEEFAPAGAESFCADGDGRKACLLAVAFERKESVSCAGVRHFVQRKTHFPVWTAPILNRCSREAIIFDNGGTLP